MNKYQLSSAQKFDHPRINRALEWLRQAGTPEPGTYEVEGKDIYALVQHYNTRPLNELKWESHQRYIDIQFIQEGTEEIGVTDRAGMQVEVPYNSEGDYALYSGSGEFVKLVAGEYLVLYPEHIHMPGRGEGGPVKKIVVKVLL